MSSISPRPASPLSLSWDISSVHNPDAYDSYRDSLADLYEVARAPAPDDDPFTSRTTVLKFGASVLGCGRSMGQSMLRTADHVRKSQLDHISIVINLADAVVDADGRDGVVAEGAVQFRDLARPSRSRTDRVDVINLITPRSSVPGWLLGRKLHGIQLPRESPGGQLVSSHLETIAKVGGALTEEEGIAAIEATFLIAERFLGGRATALSPLQIEAVQRTIRRRAIKILDTLPSSHSPDFTDVALAIGVSRSSLYRAFAPHGGVQTYMVRRRLNRAYATLRARTAATPTVEMVALQNGFSGTLQFVRAFKTQFGLNPTELHAWSGEAVTGRGALAGDASADNALHDVMLDWLRLGDETP